MPYLTEPVPPYGEPAPVAPGTRRLVARNPGPMTCHGTNTYLYDGPDGLVVIDPGPDDPAHVAAILRAARAPIAHILLTHTHADHLGAAPALREATGAPLHAWHAPAVPLTPDHPIHDGNSAAGLVALHTPGHAADHLCFAAPGGILFSGDHVMGWSSTVVSPPGGDMHDYMASLGRLAAQWERAGEGPTLYLPGHGPPIADPASFVAELQAHRRTREAAILAALGPAPVTVPGIASRLYNVGPDLRRAAERNVVAHLLKLEREGRTVREGDGWRATPPTTPSG